MLKHARPDSWLGKDTASARCTVFYNVFCTPKVPEVGAVLFFASALKRLPLPLARRRPGWDPTWTRLGFAIPAAPNSYWLLAAGYWLLVAGCWLLVAWFLGAGYRGLEAGIGPLAVNWWLAAVDYATPR